MSNRVSFYFSVMSILLLGTCASVDSYLTNNNIKESIFVVDDRRIDPLKVGSIICDELNNNGIQAVLASNIGNTTPEQVIEKKTGTGFIVSSNGYVITCAHVVDGAKDIAVYYNNVKHEAKVVSIYKENDIAILKIDATDCLSFDLIKYDNNFIGTKIYALGYPLANVLGNSVRVTDGIVSANTGIDDDPIMFQISASIQPGNSGGPIINEKYEVIGIASSRLNDLATIYATGSIPQNVNFGIKSDFPILLFSKYFNTTKRVSSLNEALKACVYISINESIENKSRQNVTLLTYNYSYYWDVVHNVITRLEIELYDKETNQLIGKGISTGDSFDGYKQTVLNVVNSLLYQMN